MARVLLNVQNKILQSQNSQIEISIGPLKGGKPTILQFYIPLCLKAYEVGGENP